MFAIKTHNIPTISSYERAAAVWAGKGVWKGNHESWRPLDDKRMVHKRLIKLDDGGYDCVLYDTSVVRYYPNRVELACYNTVSTSAFSYRVGPLGCRPKSVSGKMFWQVDTLDGVKFYAEGKERLQLAARGPGLWELTNEPEAQVIWHCDRDLAAKARKMVKAYTNWFAVVKKLTGREPIYLNWSPRFGSQAVVDFLEDHDNTEKFETFAATLGNPKAVTKLLYLHTGARYTVPSTHDHLPNKEPT